MIYFFTLIRRENEPLHEPAFTCKNLSAYAEYAETSPKYPGRHYSQGNVIQVKPGVQVHVSCVELEMVEEGERTLPGTQGD